MLTREQVENRLKWVDMPKIHRAYYEELIAHDAALRARVEELAQEAADARAQLTQASQENIDKQKIIDGLRSERSRHQHRLDTITADLQRVTEERDKWKRIQFGDQTNHLIEMEAQLTQAQQTIARLTEPQPHGPLVDPDHENCLACTQLELSTLRTTHSRLVEALKDILPYAASWLEETYGSEYVNRSEYKEAHAALASVEGTGGICSESTS